jgi:biotin carboxyl carrier protein
MRYFVTVDEQVFEVDLTAQGVSVNGRVIDVELSAIPGTSVRRLSVKGKSHTLHVAADQGKGEWDLHLDGERYQVTVEDERTHAIRAMTGSSNVAHGPKSVRAPMPGLVVRVQVTAGDEVRAGQGVLIIEAMKMENELRAESPGRVSKVHAQPGQPVEKGAVLIEFEGSHG